MTFEIDEMYGGLGKRYIDRLFRGDDDQSTQQLLEKILVHVENIDRKLGLIVGDHVLIDGKVVQLKGIDLHGQFCRKDQK